MQVEQSTLEILGALATILFALWRFYAKLEGKIDSEVSRLQGRIDSQNDARNNLAKEFSELRGEIRARFALQDRQDVQDALQQLMDSAARNIVGQADRGKHGR